MQPIERYSLYCSTPERLKRVQKQFKMASFLEHPNTTRAGFEKVLSGNGLGLRKNSILDKTRLLLNSGGEGERGGREGVIKDGAGVSVSILMVGATDS